PRRPPPVCSCCSPPWSVLDDHTRVEARGLGLAEHGVGVAAALVLVLHPLDVGEAAAHVGAVSVRPGPGVSGGRCGGEEDSGGGQGHGTGGKCLLQHWCVLLPRPVGGTAGLRVFPRAPSGGRRPRTYRRKPL